jgi:hypothetical protein
VLLSASAGKHVEKFRHFRDFLNSNRDALRQLAEMEMLYYSGQSFTSADIGYHYENLFGQVLNLVRCLDALADTRICCAACPCSAKLRGGFLHRGVSTERSRKGYSGVVSPSCY